MDEARLDQVGAHGEPDDDVRRRVRVEAAEHAMAMAAADPFIALFAFHDDLDRRRARWAHLHPTRETRRRRMFGPSHPVFIAVMLMVASVIVAVFLHPLLGLLALLILPLAWMGRDEDPAEFDESRCPDCAYDLTGVPSAIPESRLGLSTGPRACPECGASWPLVPPPG
jgi:hypothetical protein